MTNGEKFTEAEVQEFLNAAADPDTGVIRYDDYAEILANE